MACLRHEGHVFPSTIIGDHLHGCGIDSSGCEFLDSTKSKNQTQEVSPLPSPTSDIHEEHSVRTKLPRAINLSLRHGNYGAWDADLSFYNHSSFDLGDVEMLAHDPTQDANHTSRSCARIPYWQGNSCWQTESASIAVTNECIARKRFQQQRLPSTCSWLSESQQFKEWLRQEERSSLWLYGLAGSGKSVLCASLLDHLSSANSGSATRSIYWSFQELVLGESHAYHLMVALLQQLLYTITEESCKTRLEYMLRDIMTSGGEVTQPTFKKYLKEILQGAQKETQMLLVIDGLSGDHWIPTTISEEVASANRIRRESIKHKCALFCRTPVSDARSTQSPCSIVVDMDNEQGLQNDLQNFMRNSASHPAGAARRKNLIQRPTVHEPQNFLVAALVEGLGMRSMISEDIIRANADLTTLYETRLKNIVPADRPVVRRLYAWVIAAARPLTLEELVCALEIKSDVREFSSASPGLRPDNCNMVLEHELIDMSGGLLVLDQERTVSLVHSSVKDFIVATSESNNFSSTTHSFVAWNCLNYLSVIDGAADASSVLPSKTSVLHSPLEAYARTFWHWHSRLAGTEDKRLPVMIDHYLRTMLIPSEFRGKSITANAACAKNWSEEASEKRGAQPQPGSILALSSFFGFESLVEMYLQAGTSVNGSCAVCPTPLQLASKMRHNNVVEYLLQKNALITTKSSVWPDPLFISASLGYWDITKTLLRHADDTIDVFYRRALQVASLRGHTETVQVLLDKKRDVQDQKDWYGNALHIACYSGHQHVVRYFLDVGANVNVWDAHYGTPLQAASSQGHQHVVRMLLSMGAEVDACDETVVNRISNERHYSFPSYKSEHTHCEAYDLISSNNILSADHQTSLHSAAARGHTQTVETLIKRGVEVDNAMNETRETPLHLAAAQGHLLTAKLLTSAFSSAKAQSIYNGIISQDYYKSWCHHEMMGTDHLYQYVWDLDSREAAEDALEDLRNSSRSALYLNLKVASGRTALHLAAANGHQDIICHLMECGAAVDTQDNHGFTPLQSAAENGHLLAVEILLMAGAQITHGNKTMGSPILLAAKNKHYETAELLLFYSFSIEVTGSPLQDAPLNLVVQRAHSVAGELLSRQLDLLE